MTSTETLNETLIAAREAYYAGRPIMTDPEFDMAEQQLQANVKRHPEDAAKATVLRTVGDTVNTGGRIPHIRAMASIENAYAVEDLVAWAAKLGWPTLTLEEKDDGISCSLIYVDTVLTRAVTRGDGSAGESILPQVRATAAIPKTIPYGPKTNLSGKTDGPLSALPVEVRGELVIRRSTMKRINEALVADGKKPFVSPRNLVAGSIKLLDLEEVTRRTIEFIPWEIINYCFLPQPGPEKKGDASDSANWALTGAETWGFVRPWFATITNEKELRKAIAEGSSRIGADSDIACDGLVLKVDSIAYREKLGVGSKYANYQRAFKLQNARAESTLLGVTWQVGRSGKLTPVAEIEPVILAGAEVRHATINNISWISEIGLKLGSRIMVVRSGDVIPQITEVLDI
jgi:DNA ligase (NAD+)